VTVAAAERFVRTRIYSEGFKHRGLEFQHEARLDSIDESGPQYKWGFHLVCSVPCASAGIDHWPCGVECPGHQRPIDVWFDVPTDDAGALQLANECVSILGNAQSAGFGFGANAQRWDDAYSHGHPIHP
jgi:hypothetical protein